MERGTNMPRTKKDRLTFSNTTFSSRLKALMKESGLTQVALGTAIGKSRQTIAYYCDGSITPDLEVLSNIARFFQVSSDYLIGLSDDRALDATFQQVHTVTGLSKDAYDALRQSRHPNAIRLINELLADGDWIDDLCYEISHIALRTFVQEHINDYLNSVTGPTFPTALFDEELRETDEDLDLMLDICLCGGRETLSAEGSLDLHKYRLQYLLTRHMETVTDKLSEAELQDFRDRYSAYLREHLGNKAERQRQTKEMFNLYDSEQKKGHNHGDD